MKRLVALGNLVAVIAVLAFLYLAVTESSALTTLSLGADQLPALLGVFPAYVLAITFGALAWARLLHGTGTKCSPMLCIRIIFLSQAAKYIPGNVAHHVGRITLAKQHQLPLSSTLFSMFLETLWAIGIASLISATALLTAGQWLFSGLPELPSWQLLAGLCLVSLALPLAGHRLFEWAAAWWAKRQQTSAASLTMPSFAIFWQVGLLYIINYLLLGFILMLIAGQLFQTEHNDLLLLSGIFAIAWTVGFITPGAPAGLGIRELMLVGMMTPIYDAEIAVAIAATLRLVTVVGDALAFLCGLALSKMARNRTIQSLL